MWRGVAVALASVLALSSCVATKEMADKLNAQYAGRSADEFFLKYGAPATRHQLNSGDVMFLWNSGVTTFAMPETTTTTTTHTGTVNGLSGGGVTTGTYSGVSRSMSSTSGGGAIKTQCEVQLVTASDGTIRNLRITKNTIGNWLPSRCDEVLF